MVYEEHFHEHEWIGYKKQQLSWRDSGAVIGWYRQLWYDAERTVYQYMLKVLESQNYRTKHKHEYINNLGMRAGEFSSLNKQ